MMACYASRYHATGRAVSSRSIPQHERRFTGFGDKIVATYARGITVRELRTVLADQYRTDVSAALVSSVTDAVLAAVSGWQARPLEPMDPCQGQSNNPHFGQLKSPHPPT
jgi:hypothetical protein